MPTTELAIWGRVLDAETPTFTPEAARAIIALDFPQADKDRMNDLAAKARSGAITTEEMEEVENYGRVGSLLGGLKSKARASLRRAGGKNGRAK